MYSDRFDAAVAWAVDAFRPIVRKGTQIPYITHLFTVASLVGEGGGDEEQLCAAILHDAVEDIPGCTPAFLAERFGPRVSRLVVALSDSVDEHPKLAWKPRKDRYLAALCHEPPEVKLISAADKLHNARSLRLDLMRHGKSTLDRFSGGHEGTLWYHRAVVGSLAADGWDHWLLDELIHEVSRMEQLAS
jgi:(p)ppGpp synthase/HD superfamily hydrolase